MSDPNPVVRIADIIQCGEVEAQKLVKSWREVPLGGVINVAHNTEIVYDPWLPVLRMAHDDEITPDRTWWDPVLAFYDWARQKGKVLIHCHAGANRSRGTAAVLLIARHGMSPQEAEKLVGRPGFGAWIRARDEWRP